MSRLKRLHKGLLLVAVACSAAACTPMTRTGEEPLSAEEIRLRAVETKVAEVNRRINAVENKDETRMQDELRTLRGEIERLRFWSITLKDFRDSSRRIEDYNPVR